MSADTEFIGGQAASDSPQQDEARMLRQLQEILLHNERARIDSVQKTLNERNLLAEKVNPIIEEHVEFLKKNFPREFEISVEDIVDRRLQTAQEEILNLIYPKLGKMIQKYIAHQFQQLKESIDRQIESTLNRGPLGWVRRSIFGIKVSEEVLVNLDSPIIEQIFVIQRDSGLLIGSAGKEDQVDKDVLAGMLTAIKSFAEDAFARGEADLEMVQYDIYRIVMHNYPRYYIATVLGGSMSAAQRDTLMKNLNAFAEKEMPLLIKNITTETNYLIKQKLEKYFFTQKTTS